MGQTLQLAGMKCMWKVFRRPKTQFWRQIIVFLSEMDLGDVDTREV